MMKYRPIIFSGESVRAILEGHKTQTRRVINLHVDWNRIQEIDNTRAEWWNFYGDAPTQWLGEVNMNDFSEDVRCPYGVPGDRLWVRESYWVDDGGEYGPLCFYASTDQRSDIPLTPPLFMPRWASRLTLEIVSIRVERVQEITHSDAVAEGIPVITDPECPEPDERYAVLWDSLNAKRGYSWASNPLVWVVEFKRVEIGHA